MDKKIYLNSLYLSNTEFFYDIEYLILTLISPALRLSNPTKFSHRYLSYFGEYKEKGLHMRRVLLQKFGEGSQSHYYYWSLAFLPPTGGIIRETSVFIYFKYLFKFLFNSNISKYWNALHYCWKVTVQIKWSMFSHVDKSLLGRIISAFKVHYVFQFHDSSALGKSIISWHMFRRCNLRHL